MNNKCYGKGKSHGTSDTFWETLYDQVVMDTGIKKPKYHWEDVSWSNKIRVKGYTIAIM